MARLEGMQQGDTQAWPEGATALAGPSAWRRCAAGGNRRAKHGYRERHVRFRVLPSGFVDAVTIGQGAHAQDDSNAQP